MAVRRWDPFRDLLGIQNEMNRLFGRTYGPGESAEALDQGSWVPHLDVYETQDRHIITAELAGMTTADVDITVQDNERRFGSFQRRVALPRRDTAELVAEELRRLEPDEVYAETLRALAGRS